MIDFLKFRPLCIAFSTLMFVTFVGMYFYRVNTQGSAFRYSVDFTGGTQVLFQFSEPIGDVQLTNILEKSGWDNPVLRKFSNNEVLVRVQKDGEHLAESMQADIQKELPDSTVTILSTDAVGPGVGATLRYKSAQAILFGLLAMLLYIWVRFFSLSYGFGAVFSLFHDAMAIMLTFMLLNKEISINLIAAILTVLGYSINDTIVIYSRIKNNLRTMKGVPITDVINISINQTLKRTLLTSISTVLVIVSLFALGGEMLRDLSLALLVGIIFGTYSSIYIASPTMLALYKK